MAPIGVATNGIANVVTTPMEKVTNTRIRNIFLELKIKRELNKNESTLWGGRWLPGTQISYPNVDRPTIVEWIWEAMGRYTLDMKVRISERS